MLEGFAWYQTSQCLILFTLPIRLPPIRILLRDHVQHVTLLKTDTQFPARYIRIFLGIVIEVGPYVLYLKDHRFRIKKKKKKKGQNNFLPDSYLPFYSTNCSCDSWAPGARERLDCPAYQPEYRTLRLRFCHAFPRHSPREPRPPRAKVQTCRPRLLARHALRGIRLRLKKSSNAKKKKK